MGIFLLAWTIFTVYMLIGSFRTSKVLAATFSVLMRDLPAADVRQVQPRHARGLTEWGGYLGIVTAFLAWYTSAAGLLNGMYGRTVAPTFPFKK